MAISKTSMYWDDADSGDLVTVVFDAVTTLSPEDTADVTDHPVEEGADVTDNARTKPGTLSIEACVSMVPNPELDDDVALVQQDLQVNVAFPLGTQKITLDIPKPPLEFSESGLLQAGVGAIKGLLFGGGAPEATLDAGTTPVTRTVTASFIAQDSPRNRVRDVYDKLLKVLDDHTLVTVVSLHREHFDMMLTRVAAPRAVAEGTSAKFQIDLKNIRKVSSQTVAAPKPAEPRGTAQVNKGAQSGKDDKSAERKKTLLKALLQNVGVLGGGG